jgi:hypothetical protein
MASGNNQACLSGWVDVMGDQHDVFLYLVDKKPGAHPVEHTTENIQKFYNADN